MPWSRSEGHYLKPMRVDGEKAGGGANHSGSLVPFCACGVWHWGTSNGELWWACVPCGARLDRVYGMILDKQCFGSVRNGM